MSNGKKWKIAPKYVGKRSHGRRWTYRVCGGKNGKCRFQHFRHQKNPDPVSGREKDQAGLKNI